MARGSVPEAGKAEPTHGEPGKDSPEATRPPNGGDARKKGSAKADRLKKGVRKQLRRLERRLADAARAEAKRVRKLERARWRRQRLQAAVDEARAMSVTPSSDAKKGAKKAGKATPVAPASGKAASRTAKNAAKPAAKSSKPPAKAADSAPFNTASSPSATAPVEAYCLREKKRVPMLDPKPVRTANGGAAVSGTCPSCGASLYKLVGRSGAAS